MRLLITTDTVGGVWTFTSELTQQLLQRGHEVYLVSFGRTPNPAQQAWASSQTHDKGRHPEHNNGRHPERSEGPPYSARSAKAATPQPTSAPTFTYTPTQIPLEWMQNNTYAYTEGAATLHSIVQTTQPDLILSNQFCFGALPTPIPRIVVAHSDVLSWARACNPSALEPTPWLNRYTAMVQSGLRAATAVVAPTDWMGEALTANFELPHSYTVIPNGASAAPISEVPPQRKLQAITAGRLWDQAKGLDTLQTLTSTIPLLIAGENPPAPQTSPTNLTNLGPLSQPDLHHHFRQSAIYLCTSRYEPFGLAPLEAALCGCALVLRDLPSLRETWADNALYFNDNTSLTDTLLSLKDNPNLLARYQSRAHQRAQHFTPQRMTDSYLALFNKILNQQQAQQHVA